MPSTLLERRSSCYLWVTDQVRIIIVTCTGCFEKISYKALRKSMGNPILFLYPKIISKNLGLIKKFHLFSIVHNSNFHFIIRHLMVRYKYFKIALYNHEHLYVPSQTTTQLLVHIPLTQSIAGIKNTKHLYSIGVAL